MTFTAKNYVDLVGPPISAAWLNGVDVLTYSVFGGASTPSQAAAAIGAVGSATVSVTAAPYNADPTGVADSTAGINAAITAAAALGGGIVVFPAGTYKVSSQITMASSVTLSGYGVLINYVGLTGTVIASPATGALNYASAKGFVINAGTAPVTFIALNSGFGCFLEDLMFLGDSLTSTCIAMGFNTTGTVNPTGNLNCAQNFIKHIGQASAGAGIGCGTFISIFGSTSSTGIVTDNSFIDVQAQTVNVVGVIGVQWGDSNIFSGMCRIGLNGNISPANGIGVSIGSMAGGIYSWSMQHLAIDTFGAPAVDNRQGVVINAATSPKNVHIGMLFMGPQNEQNALIATNVLSYDITIAPRTSTNYQSKHLVGTNLGVGIQANVSATIIGGVGAFLSGANQYVYYAQGSGTSTATATGASYGAQPGAAASASPYTLPQVFGYFVAAGANGANATVTASYGFYCSDQNYGSSNNYGCYMNLVAGAGKYNFYAAGTAPNFFQGTTAIGGSATNDSAAAGFVGEFVQSVIGSGSAITLTTATPANVTNISLTAGDWDVWGQAAYIPAALTTLQGLAAGASTTSATFGGYNTQSTETIYSSFVPNAVMTQTPPQQRLSLASTTTVYLVAQANFGVAGMTCYGSISARRRR